MRNLVLILTVAFLLVLITGNVFAQEQATDPQPEPLLPEGGSEAASVPPDEGGDSGTSSPWVDGDWRVYLYDGSAKVGIGTDSPAEKLHINGSVRGNQSGALRISTGNGYVDIGPKNTSYMHFNTDRSIKLRAKDHKSQAYPLR